MLRLVFIMVFSFVIVGGVMGMTPFLTRKHLIFGVTFPENANDCSDVRKLKQRFLAQNLITAFVTMLPMFLGFWLGYDEDANALFISVVGSVFLTVLTGASFLFYLSARRKALAIKSRDFQDFTASADSKLMVSTTFRQEPLTVSNWLFVSLSVVIIAVTALLPVLFWEQIPSQIPMNWDFAGNPTGWIEKSPLSVMLLPLVQVLIFPVLLLSNHGLKRTKQVVNSRKPQVSVAQNRAYRMAWSRFVVVTGLSVLLMMLVLQLMTVFPLNFGNGFLWGSIVWMVVISGYATWISLKYGQGGARWQPKNSPVVPSVDCNGIIDDDNLWKLGMFYYNPSDPAIFVERRFGIGTTFNFARWQTWGIMAGLVVVIVLSTVLPLLA